MYEIIKEYNPETKLAENNGRLFVLKRISLDDVPLVKTLMNIDSPYVIGVIETTAVNGEFYAVEEFFNGITLTEYVGQRGALREDEINEIVLAICSGLAEIHSRGIVHRDINPNNVMLDGNGNVKIIDFGISREYKRDREKDTQILGTQGYAAPEQYGFSQTSAKSDIYSLGVLINYLATGGSLPYEKKAHGRFARIVEKCTEIDENNRYNNVYEIMAQLGAKTARLRKYTPPGFRSGVLWHKIVASVYYLFILICFLAFSEPTKGETLSHTLYYEAFTFFCLLLPVPIFTNYLKWTDVFPISKELDKRRKRTFPYIAGAAYTAAAFVFFIIIYSGK